MKSNRILWVVLTLCVLVLVVSWTQGNFAPKKKLPAQPASAAALKLKRIAWQPSFESALQLSRKSGKPVMIAFHADWCGVCKDMDAKVYPQRPVILESVNFISVKVDSDARQDLANKYRVNALPAILWMRGDGSVIDRVDGYADADELVQMMRSAIVNAPPPTI